MTVEDHQLTLDTRLLADLQRSPVAIGLYALVCRLFVITGSAVPLADADIIRYDPLLKRGAVNRAFRRLVESGWLTKFTQSRGAKSHYQPTWGIVRGECRPWVVGEPRMNRPAHRAVVRISMNLFDVCMGKLEVHAGQPAHIDRYVVTPTLSLTDIGIYALARNQYHVAPRPALRWFQLLTHESEALPAPPKDTLFALVSQLALHTPATHMLRPKGLRYLGIITPASSDVIVGTQPLFFTGKPMIGALIPPMIGGSIGQASITNDDASAQQSDESARMGASGSITCTKCTPRTPENNPPPSPPQQECGGKQHMRDRGQNHNASNAPDRMRALPTTKAAERLSEINALPDSIIRHADTPIVLIERAIADAQQRPGVRNIAAWTIALLDKAVTYGWQIPEQAAVSSPWSSPATAEVLTSDAPLSELTQPTMPATSNTAPAATPTLTAYVRQELHWRCSRSLWPLIDTLTVDGTPDTTRVVCPSMADVAVSEVALRTHLQIVLSELGREQPLLIHPMADQEPEAKPHLPPPCVRQETMNAIVPEQLTSYVRGELRTRCHRSLHSVIAALVVEVTPAAVHVVCVSSRDRELIERDLLAQLQVILAAVGVRLPIRIVQCLQPASVPPTTDDGRPTWIPAHVWGRLPGPMRVALYGATLDQGGIQGTSKEITALLYQRYHAQVAELIAGVR